MVKKKREMTEARRAANSRYDAKTYKRVIFTLRLQDDADIIADIEAARSQGISLRAWLHDLYYKAKR